MNVPHARKTISSPQRTFYSSSLLAMVRVVSLLGVLLFLIPLQTIFIILPQTRNLSIYFPQVIYRGLCRAIGVSVKTNGTISKEQPTLFVANHCSYLDILILGCCIPGSFIAKAEISSWPVFGILSKLQRTVFVNRKSSEIRAHKSDISTRLHNRENMILFAEGTCNSANEILPFKSSLFSLSQIKVDEKYIYVQPVCITYLRLDGVPITRHFRAFLAWFGDMSLGAHLWQLLGIGKIQAQVTFLPLTQYHKFDCRKKMTEHCQQQIAQSYAQNLNEPLIITKKKHKFFKKPLRVNTRLKRKM